MSIGTFVLIVAVVAIITLAIEAGIQDRILHGDSSWFAWLDRHAKSHDGDKKKSRTITSTK